MILNLFVALQGKDQATYNYIPLPSPDKQLLAKFGKMWWVMSQIGLNFDSKELSRSCQVGKLEIELSRGWVNQECWITWIVIWARVESARTKYESSTTLRWGHLPLFHPGNRKSHAAPRCSWAPRCSTGWCRSRAPGCRGRSQSVTWAAETYKPAWCYKLLL